MKNLLITLAVVIIMQSCKAYSKTSVSFSKAYQSQQKVIVIKENSSFSLNILDRSLFQNKFYLSKMYIKNGNYYGRFGIFGKIRIDPNRDIFYLQTDKINPWATTGLVVSIIAFTALGALMIMVVASGGVSM